jgi:hypothetical protein
MRVPNEYIIAESDILNVISELEDERLKTLDYHQKKQKESQINKLVRSIDSIRTYATALRMEAINTKAKIIAVEQWQKWILSEKNIIEPEIMKAYYDKKQKEAN